MAVIDQKFCFVLPCLVLPSRSPHCSYPSSQPSLISLRVSDSWEATKSDYRMLIWKFLLFQLFPIETWHPCQLLRALKFKKEKRTFRGLILYSLAWCFCHKVWCSVVLYHKLVSVLQLSRVNPRLLAPH